jgi:alkylated DNA repair protein alkB family protein 6
MHYYELPATGSARAPKLSLFLEPRSLVITAQEQYTERAHGIDAVSEDRMVTGDLELANAGMLGNGGCSGVARLLGDGGAVSRQTRYSLTCRDVARVMNVSIGTRKD